MKTAHFFSKGLWLEISATVYAEVSGREAVSLFYKALVRKWKQLDTLR